MPPVSKPKPSRLKVGQHRLRLRQKGLRPIQIWVPDVRAPAFLSEAHRQSLAVAASEAANVLKMTSNSSGTLLLHRCHAGCYDYDMPTLSVM